MTILAIDANDNAIVRNVRYTTLRTANGYYELGHTYDGRYYLPLASRCDSYSECIEFYRWLLENSSGVVTLLTYDNLGYYVSTKSVIDPYFLKALTTFRKQYLGV